MPIMRSICAKLAPMTLLPMSVLPMTLLLMAAVPMAGLAPALAQQNQPGGEQPPPLAPARPYKPLAVALPKLANDAALDAMRKQFAEAVKRKDRTALARLVVANGFFWNRENGDGADKRKSGIDNLSTALGLANKDGVGWDLLAGYAEDPTAAPSEMHKDAVCAPADPSFDGNAFEELLKSTQTDPSEWGYPVSDGIQVHVAPQTTAPTIDKLGLAFVRVMPETNPVSVAYLRIVTPSGKIGYVSSDALAPLGSDQICYVKEGGNWKIGGYIGAGEPQ